MVQNWSHAHLPLIHAQLTDATKTVVVGHVRRLDPVAIVHVVEAGNDIPGGELSDEDAKWFPGTDPPFRGREFYVPHKFQADDNWLKNLSLVLRNRTSKNIVRVRLLIEFPEAKVTVNGIPPRHGLESHADFGQLPANAAYFLSGKPMPPSSQKPILFAPGQEMTFPLAEVESKFRDDVELWAQSFSTISLCYIRFNVDFEDGVHWGKGLNDARLAAVGSGPQTSSTAGTFENAVKANYVPSALPSEEGMI